MVQSLETWGEKNPCTGGQWAPEVSGHRRSVGTKGQWALVVSGGQWAQEVSVHEVRGHRRSVGTGGQWRSVSTGGQWALEGGLAQKESEYRLRCGLYTSDQT